MHKLLVTVLSLQVFKEKPASSTTNEMKKVSLLYFASRETFKFVECTLVLDFVISAMNKVVKM